MVRVMILALEHSFPAGILVMHDLFRMADLSREKGSRPLFDLTLVSETGRSIASSDWCCLRPQASVDTAGPADLLVVPSGGYRRPGLDGYSRALTDFVSGRYRQGTDVAGICTGVFLLAAAGILSGKRATTHWAYEDLFRQRFPDVNLHPESIITQDDRVFCSGGGSAGVDLGLYLIEKYHGPEPARRCAAMMLLDRGREAQTPYRETPTPKRHADAAVLKAQAFIEQHMAGDVLMDQVAAHVNMSLRNFKRRFKLATGESPLAYLQRLRMETARRVLERDDTRIEDLALSVGYEDLGFFRKLFIRHTGLSPSDYRQRFRSRVGLSAGLCEV
jgi:transcriptional regulator GlxA family with amidase domain